MSVARSIGLTASNGGEVSGTIPEGVVLDAISALASALPGNDDVFADAAMQVQLGRSAGVQHRDANSVLHRSGTPQDVQLRYRREMSDLFMDLAIDIGLREAARLADAPS